MAENSNRENIPRGGQDCFLLLTLHSLQLGCVFSLPSIPCLKKVPVRGVRCCKNLSFHIDYLDMLPLHSCSICRKIFELLMSRHLDRKQDEE